MNVKQRNKKMLGFILSAALISPLAHADNSMNDATLNSLLGIEESVQAEPLDKNLKNESANDKIKTKLLFSAHESIEKAKKTMLLEEESQNLDLEIAIAEKKKELKSIKESSKLKIAQEMILKLQSEVSDMDEEIETLNEELFGANQRVKFLSSEVSMYKKELQEKKKVNSTLDGIYLTRTMVLGNNKKAVILHDMVVSEKRVGDKISANVSVSEINFDNIVITDGVKFKTIYVKSQNIVEGQQTNFKG